jgi:hypothetical protein
LDVLRSDRIRIPGLQSHFTEVDGKNDEELQRSRKNGSRKPNIARERDAMRENVLSLTVVLPDGRVVRTARRARKSSAGLRPDPPLRRLEGTLGVITQVTVRLYGIPAAISAVVCSFASIEAAKIDFLVAEHGEGR